MDLREYLEQIESQLKAVEQESIEDLMTNQGEITELCSEIRSSNQIIGHLEGLLASFQSDLSNISSEIKSLKEKSLSMSIALANRKTLEDRLNSFLRQVTLSPELIQNICEAEMNENYLQFINELRGKIAFFKGHERELYAEDPLKALSIQEVVPEIKKLTNKAASRIRFFLIGHIQSMTKPKSNPQVQQEELMKFKDLLMFLRENSQETFVEICMIYTETLSSIYFYHFKVYLNSLKKIIQDDSTKNDLIVSESTNYSDWSVPGFELKDRHRILESLNELDPVVSHTARKEHQTFYLERVFHSVIRFLSDTCSYNFAFVIDFFAIRPEQYHPVFGEIFTKTLQFLAENLANLFSRTYDFIALLLILKINAVFQHIMQKRNIPILTSFFERVMMMVWPNLQELLDRNIREMDSATYIRATDILVHPVTSRYTLLIMSLHKISPNDDMFRQRLTLFRRSFNLLLQTMAQDIRDEKNRTVFMINNLEHLMEEFINNECSPSEEFAEIEGEVWNLSENFIELQLRELFGGIMSILDRPGRSEAYHIESLIHDFNANWRKSLSLIQTIEKELFNNEAFQKDMTRRTYTKLLMKFNDFADMVKKEFPALGKHLMSVHAIMAEVQK